jgi:hypothetical protein
VRRIYKIGDPESLYARTEQYEITVEDADEYRTDPQGGGGESIAERMNRRARDAAARRTAGKVR